MHSPLLPSLFSPEIKRQKPFLHLSPTTRQSHPWARGKDKQHVGSHVWWLGNSLHSGGTRDSRAQAAQAHCLCCVPTKSRLAVILDCGAFADSSLFVSNAINFARHWGFGMISHFPCKTSNSNTSLQSLHPCLHMETRRGRDLPASCLTPLSCSHE